MKEQFRRRRLPHWDKPGAIYFVTACLEGSIPAQGLIDIAGHRRAVSRKRKPPELTVREWESRKWKLSFACADHWLDLSPACRALEDPSLAEEVEKALLHFAGERYSLWAWVVMPSHFHLVFEPIRSWVASLGDSATRRSPRERIMHSVKRHSGRQCNLLLNSSGSFWQHESYDHCIDDVDELERIISYVEANPVKAKITTVTEDYRFSSARYRQVHKIPEGRPLVGVSEIV